MALIKCPKCGKDVSDKALLCPHCGLLLNENHSATQGTHYNDAGNDNVVSQSRKKKKRMPSWLLALVITGSILLIGLIVILYVDGESSDSSATQDKDSPSKIEQGNSTILEINGVSIDKFVKYSTKYGKTYFYRDNDGLYDERGNNVYGCFDYEIIDVAEEGSDIAVVTKYLGQPIGTSEYNCGAYCITLIDQSSNSERSGMCGFDDVKISKGNKLYFKTLIADTPTELTISDIIECQDYYEEAMEYLYKKKHPIDYSWMDGNWHLSSSINNPYIGRVDVRITLKINVASHSIIMIDEDGGDDYSGTYTIDESECKIEWSEGNGVGGYVYFDPSKKLFYDEFQGKRSYFHKRSN